MIPEFGSPKPMPPIEDARECHSLFMSQINDGGIVMDFDLTPNNMGNLIQYSIPAHLENRQKLNRSIELFNRYNALIHTFTGLLLLEEVFNDENITSIPDGFYAHEISDKTLTTYNHFSQYLEQYTDTLEQYSGGFTDFEVVLRAGIQLCKIGRPGAWDPNTSKNSLVDPYYIRDTGPRIYLEFAIAQASGQV